MATFFPRSTKKHIVSFGNLHNEYKINHNKNGSLIDYTVPIRMGTKDKVLMFLNKNKQTYSTALPLIGFTLESLDFNEERQNNPITKILAGDNSSYVFNPVAYDFSFNLSVYSKTMTDLYDIVEQIIPLYRKSRYVNMIEFRFTDGSYIKRDIPVELQTATPNIPEEITSGDDRILKYDITFLMGGYIYNPIYGVDADGNSNLRDNNTINYGDGSNAKLIQHIDLRFEEYVTKYFEELSLYEETGGDIVVV